MKNYTDSQKTPMPVEVMAAIAGNANAVLPITLFVKNVPVRTSGTPGDIATIAVPAGITRWWVQALADVDTNVRLVGASMVVETAAGTLAAAGFEIYTASGGGGVLLGEQQGDISTAGTATTPLGESPLIVSSSAIIFIRQTEASANAGTVSFYITIFPLP